MALFTRPVRLKPEHREALDKFECGERALDLWLPTKALPNDVTGGSRTFVSFSTETGELAGFFSLASHSVEHDDLRAKLRRNKPSPLPTILLGRLAVSKRCEASAPIHPAKPSEWMRLPSFVVRGTAFARCGLSSETG